MDDVCHSQPGAPEPGAPARPEARSRTRRKLLLASLLCVAILLVPIPGSQQVVGGLLVEAYRQVIGYPVVGVLIRFGWQAEIDHQYADAERDYTLALTIGAIALGEGTPLMGLGYERLGNLYRLQQRYIDAVPAYRRAISIVSTQPDLNRSYLAGLRESLSRTLMNTGDVTGATQEAHFAAALREGQGDDQALASSLNLLGNDYLVERAPEYAKPVLQRAVDLYDADPDTDDLDLAAALNNLGIALEGLGEYDSAKTSLQRSLQIRQSELGPDHPQVAKMLNNLGTLASRQKDRVTARSLFEQALAIYNRHPQAQNPDVADTFSNLGGIAFVDGRYADAEALDRQALATRERASPNDPFIDGDLVTLGIILQASGRPEEALPLYQRAVSLDEPRLPLVGTVADRLDREASAYLDLDQPEMAEPLLSRALSIAGPQMSNLLSLRIRVDTASVHRRARGYALAEQMLEESLAWARTHYPPDTPEIADASLELGLVYLDQARFAEAEMVFNQVLATQTRTLGPEHPWLSSTYVDFGRLYAATGRAAEAAVNAEHGERLRRGLPQTS
jgi:tetratricopeptide (TPR) repeat protein